MNESTILEPVRTLQVVGAYDVVVVGGGIAGVAAALAAVRNGVSVCLIEKAFGLGGLATLGNVINYLPICDGNGRQVMSGLAEELLRLSVVDVGIENVSARFRKVPACWQPGGDVEERKKVRFRVDFNPASYAFALEKMVVEAGIHLMYDTKVCAVDHNGDMICHLIVENKSGRVALACKTVVDATGDADICFLAKEKTESLDSNVLCGWFYTLDNSGLKLRTLTNKYSPYAMQEGATGPFFRGDDAEQVTAQVLGSRELIRSKLAEFRERDPDSDIQLVMPPSMACFRMTRRLVGAFSLGEKDMHTFFDDITGFTGDWRKRGPVYAIPMRALCGVHTKNLLAAGRCISADTTVWDVTRAIPTCALTGEASGTAAALSVHHHHGDVHALPIDRLQHRLKAQGGLLSPDLAVPVEEGLMPTGSQGARFI